MQRQQKTESKKRMCTRFVANKVAQCRFREMRQTPTERHTACGTGNRSTNSSTLPMSTCEMRDGEMANEIAE